MFPKTVALSETITLAQVLHYTDIELNHFKTILVIKNSEPRTIYTMDLFTWKHEIHVQQRTPRKLCL